ncbi:hypothetical protein MAR_025925 [Mya arenaria]|uniref:THAP-type domain-containing protein n=2 Tax=Mya arenaria TaxID=6604 RepID=A0ABY7EPG5_MYAAR|nr:uncharacterized protein LOC128242598 [Mya arenaria]WAR11745.1 hypothetical protein MAR_025925 [Mya arenaria]
MPSFCAVFGCSNRHDRENDRSYYRLPKVITHQGEQTKKLSQDRREKWLSNIARDDLKPSSYDNLRICSDHFIKKPADLYDQLNPDWAPTVKMGHIRTFMSPSPSKSRYNRSLNRSVRKQHTAAAMSLLELRCSTPELESEDVDVGVMESGTSTQTDIDKNLLTAIESELQVLQKENREMKAMLEEKKLDESFFRNDSAKVKYYTGLPDFTVLQALYHYVEPDITLTHKSALNKFQKLIIVLMKLRLNTSNLDLAIRFGVSDSTVSRVFQSVIDVLSVALRPLIHWPDRESLKKTMPMSFRTHFGTKVSVIIDCFEVFMERPSNLKARAETWSNYKHSHTAKYLIGIAPQGVISFISNGYGGRASDKTITENSGILDKLVPGDLILADRGFDIQESVGTMCAQVYIPAFTKGKAQLGALDVEKTRRIANSRIHVERVIGLVRQKYQILSSKVPHDYLQTDEDKTLALDKIVHVCCALTNMCNSVVPFN